MHSRHLCGRKGGGEKTVLSSLFPAVKAAIMHLREEAPIFGLHFLLLWIHVRWFLTLCFTLPVKTRKSSIISNFQK